MHTSADVQSIRALLSHEDPAQRKQGCELLSALDQSAWDSIFENCTIAQDGTIHGPAPWSDELLSLFLANPTRHLGEGMPIRGLRLGALKMDASKIGQLACLDVCPALTHLDISGLPSVSGPLISRIAGLGRLQHLDAFGVDLSEGQMQAIVDGNPGCTIDRRGRTGTFIWHEPEGRGIRIAAAFLPFWKDGKISHYYWAAYGYSGGGCQGDLVGKTTLHGPGEYSSLQGDMGLDLYRYAQFHADEEWEYEDDETEMDAEDTRIFEGLINVLCLDLELDEDSDFMAPTDNTRAQLREIDGAEYRWDGWCLPGFFVALMRPAGFLSGWGMEDEIDEIAAGLRPELPSFDVHGNPAQHTIVFSKYCEVEDEKYDEYGDEIWEFDDDRIAEIRDELIAEWTVHFKGLAADLGLTVVGITYSETAQEFVMLTRSDRSLYQLDHDILKATATWDGGFMSVTDIEMELTQGYDPGSHDTGSLSYPAGHVHYEKHARKWRDTQLPALFANA